MCKPCCRSAAARCQLGGPGQQGAQAHTAGADGRPPPRTARPPVAKVADPPPLRRRPGVVQGSCGSAPSPCPKESWTARRRPTT